MKRHAPEEPKESHPLFDAPHARKSDPPTSHYAAARVDADVCETIRARVLHVLRTRGPSTHEEILAVFSERQWDGSPSGVRTRCKELLKAGMVRDTGEMRDTEYGRASVVWAAVRNA